MSQSRNRKRSRDSSRTVSGWRLLVKTFRLTRFELCSQMIDGEHAAVHWRVDIHSRITGAILPTELVDLIEVRGARIRSYTVFVPR